MSSLKCVRSLIPVDTFSACHPSKRLCPGVRQLSGMDGATIGKSAAAKAAVLNHIKGFSHTLYTVDATKFDMAQIDATFHEGRGKWSADNQVVGIGSGTTIISAVKTLAERVSKENLKLVCIPTSFQARQLILEHKLTLGSLEQYPELDVAIDGADEIDKDLVCIKGGGGCLTQEKIVAYNAKEFIVCVEESKNVPELGTYWKKGIPLEVMPLAYRPLQLTIESKFGGHADLRMASRKMGPVVSDNGNFILDWRFDKVGDWSKINNQLIHIPGIVETGIFTGMVTKAYIGSADGTVIVKDRNSNSPGTVVETGLFIGMVSKAYIGRGDGTVIVKDRNCNDASSAILREQNEMLHEKVNKRLCSELRLKSAWSCKEQLVKYMSLRMRKPTIWGSEHV